MKGKHVEKVYQDGLCNSCGICAGVCLKKAITYKHSIEGLLIPQIDTDICINCHLCTALCPGKQYYKNNVLNTVNYFTAHSTSTNLRKDGASGGFVTELLCYLIENNIVDYCVVVPTVKDNLLVKPIITEKKEIIRNSCGSKYIVVNYGEILDEIIKTDKIFAMVVLPCQGAMIKNALGEESDRLYMITLMCNHMTGTTGSAMLLNHRRSNRNKFELRYRGNGWPGNMSIDDKNIGAFRDIYHGKFGKFFVPLRCRLCDNHMGDDSEITAGDPYFWNEENHDGNTFVICRSNRMQNLIMRMLEDNLIELEHPLLNEDVIRTAYDGIFRAEELVGKLLSIRKKFHLATPDYSEQYICKITYKDYKKYLGLLINKVHSKILAFKFKTKGGSMT